MRLYLDTNVYMDFIENRDSSAYSIIMQTVKCFHEVVFSVIIIDEITFQGYSDEFSNIIKFLGTKATKKTTNMNDRNKARKLPTHYNDALHALHSRKTNSLLITNNLKDFRFMEKDEYAHPNDIR
jgi:predicted nucleic acid-binding protein